MTKKIQLPEKQKADPNRQYDVLISVTHDDRAGKCRSLEKPMRYSFATEDEALAFTHKLGQIKP